VTTGAQLITDKRCRPIPTLVAKVIMQSLENIFLQVFWKQKQKLADKWEHDPYIVISQPNHDIPVYQVKREGARYKKTSLNTPS
jgi:hypothetical protein